MMNNKAINDFLVDVNPRRVSIFFTIIIINIYSASVWQSLNEALAPHADEYESGPA